MTTEDAMTETEPEAPYSRRWAAMVVLILAFALDLLSVTIVNVALPAIQRGLGAGPTDLEWISAGYLLAFAVALITAARLGDLWGRKRVFLVGLAAFGLASAWCGLAHGPGELIAARAAQGLAAAALTPQVMSIMYTIFHGRERATVFGVFGIISSFAQAGGLALGGVLVTADLGGLGWRTIFLVTVPAVFVLVGLGAWLIPESRAGGAARPRPVAAAVLTVGLVAIVFPLLEGQRYGWPAWCAGCLVVGLGAVVGLALAERGRPGALLPVELLRLRPVATGLAVMLLAFSGFSGFLLVFALWLQDGQGYSPLAAGLVTVAFPAGALPVAPFIGRLTVRYGRRVVLTGCAAAVLGALAVLVAAGGAPRVGAWALVPGLVLLGAGINLCIPPLVTLYLAAVPPRHAGSASGILSTVQQFGGALGVAVLGAVFFAGLAGGYPAAITGSMITMIALLVAASAAVVLGLTPKRAR
ncbi:MFS transporter [Pseudonocardia acaciae]|uniref:MFS transporter n=1 Tax=Pseudonocardia acaciae TaxID=551276 RepID=UPI00056AA950|nr:MFS transporter [Pseudonocardia acaciae]